MTRYDAHIPVLIVGGGPVGLTLALELNFQGVEAVLVERNLETTQHPKMDITNSRSMELYRRLGIADEIRSHAVPSGHPLSVVWATRLGGELLARFDYPSVYAARLESCEVNDGTYPLEPSMRISQAALEPALKSILERDGSYIDVRFGWQFISFEQDGSGVTSVIKNTVTGETQTIRSDYLAGCDGADSRVRRGLGIELEDIPLFDLVQTSGGVLKNLSSVGKGLFRGEKPPDGRIYIVHFKSTETDVLQKFGPAWHTQFPSGATLIAQNDKDIWTLHAPLRAGDDSALIDGKAFLFETLGREFDCEILLHNAWNPRLAVAESYGEGRVWLAGDSAHQVIPTGGYGMNTGVGDAIGLGWVLGANIQGWGTETLLDAYAAERRSVALINRDASREHMAVRMKITQAYSAKIERDEIARHDYAAHILGLGNLENEAAGLELGYVYDTSPVIVYDDKDVPSLRWGDYQPCTAPGMRPPSLLLDDGTALFDLFYQGFTLLRFSDEPVDLLAKAAKEKGLPLKIVDIRDEAASELYQQCLVLLRPDQHVAWRGDTLPKDTANLIDFVRGA